LLPADGFFEWMRKGKEKQPFHFGMQDDSLFAFAGCGIDGETRPEQ